MGDWPGARSTELQQQREQYVPRGMSSAMPVFAASGQGATLTDVDGKVYIDFATGISVMNVGHSHPRVIAAIRQQADQLVHSGAPVMMPEAYIRLARRLCEITPGRFPKKALLINSGAEAIENAVKIARQATGRPAVISFHNAFHGRTLMSMTLTGKVAPYKQNFGPYAPEVYQVPYPYEYRRPAGMAAESLGGACVEAVRQLFKTTVSADRVAGIRVGWAEHLAAIRSRAPPLWPSSTCCSRRNFRKAGSGSATGPWHGCARGKTVTRRSAMSAGSAPWSPWNS